VALPQTAITAACQVTVTARHDTIPAQKMRSLCSHETPDMVTQDESLQFFLLFVKTFFQKDNKACTDIVSVSL
jgi:hypothetical protein